MDEAKYKEAFDFVMNAHKEFIEKGPREGKRLDLRGQNLEFADFREARFCGTQLGGANFTGANFSGALGLPGTSFRSR